LIAEKLREKEIQSAFATSLSRSSNTLDIVLKHHPECKKVIVDDRLIERSYGHLKKKHPKTVIKNFGKTQFDLWHRSYDVAPPGSESMKMVEKRDLPFTKDLLTLMKKEKINVTVSAHNNSMKPFRRYFENLAIKQMMALENTYDKVFDYIIEC
jgi:2,3-bisphosphoglycerate-dependent phosphoglycerate mutase